MCRFFCQSQDNKLKKETLPLPGDAEIEVRDIIRVSQQRHFIAHTASRWAFWVMGCVEVIVVTIWGLLGAFWCCWFSGVLDDSVYNRLLVHFLKKKNKF
jgi:hypothetical protein